MATAGHSQVQYSRSSKMMVWLEGQLVARNQYLVEDALETSYESDGREDDVHYKEQFVSTTTNPGQ